MNNLQKYDPEFINILNKEIDRQQYKINLIASENFPSKAVREATSSVFMNKYSEGEIGKRYYEGNEHIDELETLCKERLSTLFNLPKDWGVNVHALSGANANLGVYLGILNMGDKILSMYLPDGGHLSHGWSFEPDESKRTAGIDDRAYRGGSRKISIVSMMYDVVQYKTDPKTELFDYDEIERIALAEKPKLIISGGTAYVREIDYVRLAEIAKKVGALYMADVAHEAGLIAAGVNKSPVGVADVVTFTTHKTFRGPRGAVIFSKPELKDSIDRGIFPMLQGGPHNDIIAGITVAAKEALEDDFKKYATQVVENAQRLASELHKLGFYIVSGGTDKHSLLINLLKSDKKYTKSKFYTRALSYAGIITNKTTVPGEAGTPVNPSGIRLGTPTVTTRGFKAAEMTLIAKWIDEVGKIADTITTDDFEEFDKAACKNEKLIAISKDVKGLCEKYRLIV